LFAENVAILEQMQTEKMSIEAQVQLEEEQEIAIEKGL
jgi:hypothetical protein